MGRSVEFDRDVVLSGAMEAFRHRGYGAVSIKDLEAATGLKSGSLYHSFGDKAGLFQAAFDHYLKHVLDDRIATYADPQSGTAGLEKLFLTLLDEPGGGAFGCLITNSAIEFSAEDAGVRLALERLHTLFSARLTAAKRTHIKLSPPALSMPATAAATRLLALYQGVLVLVRAGWDKQGLRRMIRAEFQSLKGE